jgi:hypothetical protein
MDLSDLRFPSSEDYRCEPQLFILQADKDFPWEGQGGSVCFPCALNSNIIDLQMRGGGAQSPLSVI